MSGAVLVACACALAWGGGAGAARILVAVPTPSFSHQVVFRPLTQELARRGHEVVVLTTDPAFPPHHAPPNLTEIDLHDLSYDLWTARFLKKATGDLNDVYMQVDTAYDLMVEIFAKQMRTKGVKSLLEDDRQHFDLVIVEAWTRAALVLTHRFHAPAIQMSSLGVLNELYEAVGAPVHPTLYPDFLRTRIYNLTLWEKVKELYNRYQLHRLIMSYEDKEDAMLREVFGPDTPSVSELQKNVDLLFVNVDPLWDGFRPVPPNVIHLGGLQTAPPKELPQDLKAFMDASNHGVIYMSFGTNTDPALLPAERMAVFARVFGALPYDVLWKWREAPPGLPANVRTESWLPQPDLLRHEKLVLFITQAGLQSTDEALRAGVPLLALPMLGDQWYNAEQYRRHGVGLRLDLASITDQQLREAIETLINDKSFRANSAWLGREMQDRPQSTLARAAWWAERALRRRGPRARAPAALLPWARFLELDLVLAALAAVFAALAAIGVAACCVYQKLFMDAKKVKAA